MKTLPASAVHEDIHKTAQFSTALPVMCDANTEEGENVPNIVDKKRPARADHRTPGQKDLYNTNTKPIAKSGVRLQNLKSDLFFVSVVKQDLSHVQLKFSAPN